MRAIMKRNITSNGQPNTHRNTRRSINYNRTSHDMMNKSSAFLNGHRAEAAYQNSRVGLP